MSGELNKLFSSEGPKLRRFLRRFSPKVSPEDIAQESFERLHAVGPEKVHSPRAFLYQTARNLAINAWHRENTAPVRGAYVLPAESRSPDLNPEERLIVTEALERLSRALSGLPRHKKTALILFKLERRSYKEIAAQLRVSPRTVERYVADALAHCHKELRDLRED